MYLFAKIYQLKLFINFIMIPTKKFNDPIFDELKVLETFTNKNLSMSWCVDLNGEEANCLVIEYFLS
jgi:hypothetical protein